MASQGVALDPFQNIVSVGWNAGPFLWLAVAFEIQIPGFGVLLTQPTIADYDPGSSNSIGPEAGWPTLLPPDYHKYKTHFVYFAEVVNSEGGSNIGAGVYFVNIGLIYKEHAKDFTEQDLPLRMALFSGHDGDEPTEAGTAKVRAYVYKPKSIDLISTIGWQPGGGIGSATTLDQVLDNLPLIGAELAGRPGDDESWYSERFYNVPGLSGGVDFQWGHWTWDFRKRNDAVTYPPAGADPVLD
jgi:hypothetical protein